MKNYEYTKTRNTDYYMNHQHDTVDEWLSDVADQQENLDFLDDEDFHKEMCFSYILDEYRYANYCWPPCPDDFWKYELDVCGITSKDVQKYIDNNDEIEGVFEAGYTALKNLFSGEFETPSAELVEKFYRIFCEIDPDYIEEVEE